MGSLQGTADNNPGNSALLHENHSTTSFWAGANGGDDSLAVFRLSGDSLHVALGLYLCVQQQQFCVASLG